MLLVAAACWGCAGPLVAVDGGFEHARHGYRIDAAPQAAPPWQRVEVEESVLAYRHPGFAADDGPVWMTLSSRCGVPLTRPSILARHLRIGIPDHTVRESGAVESHGLAGWQQVFDVAQGGAVVRMETVTLVTGDCAVDAVLSARGASFRAARPDFEAWWRTLRPTAPAAAAAGEER